MRREAYASYPKKPGECTHPACHGVAPYIYCILCGLEWETAMPTLGWDRIASQVIAKILADGLNPQDVELFTEETADGRLLLGWRPRGGG